MPDGGGSKEPALRRPGRDAVRESERPVGFPDSRRPGGSRMFPKEAGRTFPCGSSARGMPLANMDDDEAPRRSAGKELFECAA